jgi:guanine deaminase
MKIFNPKHQFDRDQTEQANMTEKQATQPDQTFMQMAIDLAIANVSKGGGPFGAVIVKDGEIIAQGVNQVTGNNDPTAHAEIMAIRYACQRLNNFRLDGCEIYSSCEPCPMCLGAIYWARCDRLFFASSREDAAAANFDDSFIYEQLERPLEKRSIPTQQFLRQESLKAFQTWCEQENRIHY